MGLFVFHFYPVRNFIKFISLKLGTVRSERVKNMYSMQSFFAVNNILSLPQISLMAARFTEMKE